MSTPGTCGNSEEKESLDASRTERPYWNFPKSLLSKIRLSGKARGEVLERVSRRFCLHGYLLKFFVVKRDDHRGHDLPVRTGESSEAGDGATLIH